MFLFPNIIIILERSIAFDHLCSFLQLSAARTAEVQEARNCICLADKVVDALAANNLSYRIAEEIF